MSQMLAVSIATVRVRVAAGVVAGQYVGTLQRLDADGTVTGDPLRVESATPQLTFDNIEDGEYHVVISRLDNNGAQLAQAVEDVIIIANGAVTTANIIDLPAGLSYNVVTADSVQ